jgi:hypothetical protein
VLVSVISLSSNEGQLTGRSQSWNGAIPVAEAGIEEAFTHLKYCPTNRASNGWTLTAGGDYYTKSRTNDASGWYYQVSISTNYDPTIIARGGIRAPLQANNYIVRTVRVTATNEPMFSAAIEATEGITFVGGRVTINSYDSRDPDRYYNPVTGLYDPTKFNANGRVVCHYGPFDMGNSKIYAHVETGDESTFQIGANGVVGSIDYHQRVGSGVEPGWLTSTTSSEFSDIDPPTDGTPLPIRPNYVFTNANASYTVGTLQGSVVVKATNVTLLVNNNYNVSELIIERGASLKLYVNAGSVALRRINNLNLRAESFMYYGLPNNVIVDMSGNAAFCGVLFAPSAALGISGGGNNELDFQGAIIARTVTVNGKMTFHFDEAVMRLGSRGFVANRWDEL